MKRGILLLTFTSFLFYSCYEAVEGCTDPLASNYLLSADESCKSCCSYPELLVKIRHSWGTDIFQNGKEYTLENGQKFSVINHKFYLSNIKIYDENAEEVTNRKTSLFTSGGRDRLVLQNICLVNGTLSDCRSGAFKVEGKLSKLVFENVIPMEINQLDSSSVARDPSLSWSEGMYRNGTYQGFFFSIAIPGRSTPLNLYFTSEEEVTLPLNSFRHEKPGKPIEINVAIDYSIFFKNLDFAREETLTSVLAANFKGSFKAN